MANERTSRSTPVGNVVRSPRPASYKAVLITCLLTLVLCMFSFSTHDRHPPDKFISNTSLPTIQAHLLRTLSGQAIAHHSGLLSNIENKSLVWQTPFDEGDQECRLYLFDREGHMWPGYHPVTIVITDAQRQLLTWKEVGGQPCFTSAELEGESGRRVLAINFAHRAGPHGIHRFRISTPGIERFGEVDWSGRREADMVWKSSSPCLSGDWGGEAEIVKDAVVFHQFDAETGLPFRTLLPPRSNSTEVIETFYRDFDDRMRELVRQHGLPSWSYARKIKVFRLPASELVAMLDTASGAEMLKLPHQINEHLFIARGPYSDEHGSFGDGVMLVSGYRMIDLSPSSDTSQRIYLVTNKKYPELVFVRRDNETLIALTTEGIHIATASRAESDKFFVRLDEYRKEEKSSTDTPQAKQLCAPAKNSR